MIPKSGRRFSEKISATCLLQAAHAIRLDGPVEALERQFSDRLGHRQIFDRGPHLAVDEDLTIGSLPAKAGSKIDHHSDRRVVEPALKANPAERGIAVR